MHKIDNVKYYDTLLSRIYDLIYSEEYIGRQTLSELNFISKYITKKTILLDVGCGSGRHLKKLAGMVHRIVAIDPSLGMLKIAESKAIGANNCTLLKTGIESFCDSETFDVAMMIFTVVNHITDQHILKRGFTNVFKSLRKGGKFIFDLTNFYSFLDSFKKDQERFYFNENSGQFCIRHNHHAIDGYSQYFVNQEWVRFFDGHKMNDFSNKSVLKIYSVGEILLLLNSIGFSEVTVYSDWKHKKSIITKRHIFVCTK